MTTENTAPALAAATLAHTTGRVTIPADMDPIVVLGVADQVLRALERGFPHVRFLVTGREISLAGTQADIDVAAGLLEELIGMARRGTALDATAVEQAIGLLGRLTSGEAPTEEILSARGRSIRPKTPGQKAYTDAIDRATVVFGIGPAGTGKTYLAMAQAVRRLLSGEVRRIVLTRPAVEAGENLEHAARREAKEETGIDLGEVRYLGSQPWPFPASLMMAFKAQALSTDILVDGEETETARWVTRDEYTIELSEGRMEAPGKSTIARYMIEEWYGREL